MALTKISSNLVADDAIVTGKIADGGVGTADLAANAVTSAKIAQNSILTKHIDDGQVDTAQIAADAITGAKIADDAISEEHLDVTVISSLTEVTAVDGDYVLIGDTSDSNNLKKVLVSSIRESADLLKTEATGNGSTVAYTLNEAPSSENATMVFFDGVYQHKSTYAVSGSTLTFDTAPLANTDIEIMASTTAALNVPADDSVQTAKIADNAVTSAKIASNSILTRHIDDDQITGDQLATNIAISGTLSAGGAITGTLATAAQTNITSLGTLTGLTGGTGDLIWDTPTFVVDSSANSVGIGTTSNQSWAKLEVVGTAGAQTGANQAFYVRAPSTTANEGVGIRMSAASGSNEAVGIIGMVNNASGNSGSMTFHTYNGGGDIPEAMRIDNTGRVGIGTASPDAPLNVVNSAGMTAQFSGYSVASGANNARAASGSLRLGNGAGTTGLLLDYTDQGQTVAIIKNEYVQSTSSEMRVQSPLLSFYTGTSPGESMRIDSGGQVGIGTTSPTSYSAYADNLVVAGNGETGITIASANSSQSGLYFADGTSGAQQYAGYLDYNHSSDVLIIGVGGGEKMRIDSSGKVGIGTNSPSSLLHVDGSFSGTAVTIHQTRGSAGTDRGLDVETSSTGTTVQRWLNSGTELMRVGGNGDVHLGQTTPYAAGDYSTLLDSYGRIYLSSDVTGGGDRITFANPNGTVGTIRIDGSSTAYNTSSDYRLKENVDYTWDATTRLKQLKPARFNFIADDTKTVDGFLAHEVSSIVPEAISGQKDETDDEGNPIYQGIDQAKLVPLLVKTVQELEARIKTLEG